MRKLFGGSKKDDPSPSPKPTAGDDPIQDIGTQADEGIAPEVQGMSLLYLFSHF